MAAPLPFQTLVQDTRAGTAKPVLAAARSATELADLALRREVPDVDFTRASVIVVAVGTRPDASVEVEIRRIVRTDDGDVEVFYAEHPSGSPADVVSYPAHVVSVERLGDDTRVRFEAERAEA